ncbi:MAG TPA: nucleotidyltransferase family protein [bacterium]|nr:nucleotidyltransferase family protein [bacterium]HOY45230.1 nucleotidyltransferase family protein [bacterium]HPG83436.1 nucleotidyltransferase family protein [bacterium]HPM58980.1 nucleotidyltransferase family protein [bacterium]
MRAFILVGGLGTRLRALGITQPKAMVDIGGRPFLEYLVRYLARHNLREIVFCIGYGAEEIRSWFDDGSRWGVKILYSAEKSPLGTGGALKQAESFAVEENLVCNGDSFLELELPDFANFHRKRRALASIAAINVHSMGDYGNIQTGRGGRINAFAEKSAGGRGLINGGVYLLQREVWETIPGGGPLSLEREIFPRLAEGGRCYAYKTAGYFLDIGTPERLDRARAELPSVMQRILP